MVDRVLELCRTRLLWEDLLAQVKGIRPRQYARFEPELFTREVKKPRDQEPARPTPEILTTTNPIEPELVRIPAGPFLMGTSDRQMRQMRARLDWAKGWIFEDEQPQHRVRLPAYQISRYPVTNAQYAAFVQATAHDVPSSWSDDRPPREIAGHPVANVSWHDAQAYVAWLRERTGQPYRLPTEAEWEKATRGTDGRIYPWGDQSPDESRCNFAGQVGDTTPMGRYSPQGDSPYGCADMAGNICEWCRSLHRPYPYRAGDGREDLQADGSRVVRGGSFVNNQWFVRCASRNGSASWKVPRTTPSAACSPSGATVVAPVLPSCGECA
jgi:formylglycine-generating enzyme required for sulfatase activity